MTIQLIFAAARVGIGAIAILLIAMALLFNTWAAFLQRDIASAKGEGLIGLACVKSAKQHYTLLCFGLTTTCAALLLAIIALVVMP